MSVDNEFLRIDASGRVIPRKVEAMESVIPFGILAERVKCTSSGTVTGALVDAGTQGRF